MKRFFVALYWWWKDWAGGVWVFLFLALVVGMSYWCWYNQTHKTIILEPGIVVRTTDDMWFCARVPETGAKNQFFASNELATWISSDMTMEPRFALVNTSDEPREIQIHSLSAWQTPFRGDVRLEPGQEFRFQFQAVDRGKHWYCWIWPKPVKSSKKIGA